MTVQYFDRDLSWLSFNERVLLEAGNPEVPIVERVKFLSIFSSNLDEFYRVRMPVLMATRRTKDGETSGILENISAIVLRQQAYFGEVLTTQLLPSLKQKHIHLLYQDALPAQIIPALEDYFYSSIAAFLQVIKLSSLTNTFFSENNKLYQVVTTETNRGEEEVLLLTVPSDSLPRFFSVTENGTQYIVFIEDIIQHMVPVLFPGMLIKGIFNIKVTRDAELDLEEEVAADRAEEIETKIAAREMGYATRFLHEPGIPLRTLYWLTTALQVSKAQIVAGGKYHNLKDLSGIPVNDPRLNYPRWPVLSLNFTSDQSLFDAIQQKDRIVHTPYQSYNMILRFFNEAAIDPTVEEVYVTMYRVASDSKIANALITAARNGKKVVVFVELKARFDEANNIRWARLMKDAGIRIIYSIPNLKVHAKVALVKRRRQERMVYLGLLSTGNLNESTAKFYTDHILLTAHRDILLELEMLFIFLGQKRKPVHPGEIIFRHLLVAQFNLQSGFFELIDKEISYANQGLPAAVTIKLNNLEEKKMIDKLYEASQAGVKVNLIVRSICCLQPGQPGISENIKLTRIVDRYLEHGRIFVFHNNGDERLFLGSADWMSRNIYGRVEVCFPIYDPEIRKELKAMIDLQLSDNVQAVSLNATLGNVPVTNDGPPVRSQEQIYQLLAGVGEPVPVG